MPSVVGTLLEVAVMAGQAPANGGTPETLLPLPFDEVGSVTMFPDGRRFVVSVYSSRFEVWVADNFDVTPPLTIAGSVKWLA